MKKFQIICIPDWLGSAHREGVQLGPKALVKSIMSSSLKKNFVKQFLSISVPEPNHDHVKGEYEKTKYLPEIKQICKRAKTKIAKVIGDNKIPIVLIGDDSSMIGVLAGISRKKGNDYCVAYFDAHGDINTPKTTPSGGIYGMPLAHLLGHGNKELVKLNGRKSSLKYKNIVLIGQRALDPGETVFIKKHNILCYSSKQANRLDLSQISEDISRRTQKGLYIHIDLDVLDPKISPGVSLTEKGGLPVKKLLGLVGLLVKKSRHNIGLSISEYNPKKDPENKTKKIVLKIVKEYIKCVSESEIL